MLGQHFKFHIVNNLGLDMDLDSNSANEVIQINWLAWKLNSSGALTWDAEETRTFTTSDIADGVSFEFAAKDNSSDLFVGLVGEMNYLTDDASAAGTVDLYVEYSTDGGTIYPSDAADFIAIEDLLHVAILNIAGDGAGYKRSINFEVA